MFGFFKKKVGVAQREQHLSLADARAMEKNFLFDFDGDCLKDFIIRSTDFMVESDRIPGVSDD